MIRFTLRHGPLPLLPPLVFIPRIFCCGKFSEKYFQQHSKTSPFISRSRGRSRRSCKCGSRHLAGRAPAETRRDGRLSDRCAARPRREHQATGIRPRPAETASARSATEADVNRRTARAPRRPVQMRRARPVERMLAIGQLADLKHRFAVRVTLDNGDGARAAIALGAAFLRAGQPAAAQKIPAASCWAKRLQHGRGGRST
jgi:hypothetical protein